MADRVRGLPGVESVKVAGTFNLAVRRQGGVEHQMLLHNLYAEIKDAGPGERAERIAHRLASLSELGTGDSWAAAAELLLPVVRTTQSLKDPVRRLKGAGAPVHQALASFLVTMFVIDRPHTMQYVEQHHLRHWALDVQAVADQALTNLRGKDMSPLTPDGPGPGGAAGAGGAMLVAHPVSYGSSWLALPGIFEDVSSRLGGEVVGLAPERDMMCFVRTDQVGVLGPMLSWAQDRYDHAQRGISPVPYVQNGDGRLTEWAPPAGHPCRPQVERARGVLALNEYEHQRRELEARAAERNEEVFVAELSARQERGGRTVTTTTWPKDVKMGLLPVADEVSIAGPEDGEVLVVRWEDATDVGAPWVQPVPDELPARLRVNGWPEEAMAELRRRALRIVRG